MKRIPPESLSRNTDGAKASNLNDADYFASLGNGTMWLFVRGPRFARANKPLTDETDCAGVNRGGRACKAPAKMIKSDLPRRFRAVVAFIKELARHLRSQHRQHG